MQKQGKGYKKIAGALNVPRDTVGSIVGKFKVEGTVAEVKKKWADVKSEAKKRIAKVNREIIDLLIKQVIRRIEAYCCWSNQFRTDTYQLATRLQRLLARGAHPQRCLKRCRSHVHLLGSRRPR